MRTADFQNRIQKDGDFVLLSLSVFAGCVLLISLSGCSRCHPPTANSVQTPVGSASSVPTVSAPPLPENKKPDSLPALNASATGSVSNVPAPMPIPVVDPCVFMTFQHKALPAHASDESCSHHRNLLRILRTDIQLKSLCVRVNGAPVPFQVIGAANKYDTRILLGPIAGPRSKITARFCVKGGLACKAEECVVPKDEFLEAIGGTSDSAQLVKWDPKDTAPEKDIVSEIDPAVMKELLDATELGIFEGWVPSSGAQKCSAKGV